MDMLTISEFRTLPFETKCDIVLLGTYVHHRRIGEVTVFLYHVNNFFIEVFYSIKANKNILINTFTGVAELEQYIDNISLADLNGIII